MDQEVAKTLAELELKLRELERELASIGRRAADPRPTPPIHSQPPPIHPQPPPIHPQPPPIHPQPPPTHSQPPPIHPPPPIHSQPPPTHSQQQPAPPLPPNPPGRLVDEAVELGSERRYSMETQETAFGEIPATKDKREAIELAELVHFKAQMQRTLQGLIDEYGRLLSLRPRP